MTLFIIVLLTYVSALSFYRPSPESLRAAPPSYVKNLQQVKATVSIGVVLLLVFLITTRWTFTELDPQLYITFGLNNLGDTPLLWPVQIITHSFMHASMIHLLSNLVGIGIASVYERRVGSKRYLMVLVIGIIASMPSIFFYSEPHIVTGISGGLFALASAFFTDHKDLTLKEWIYAVLTFFLLGAIYSISNESRVDIAEESPLVTDHIGHLMGALGGIAFCRLAPLQNAVEPIHNK